MVSIYCVLIQKCLRTNLTVFQKLFAPSQTTYISRQYTQHKTYLKFSKGLLTLYNYLWDKNIVSY